MGLSIPNGAGEFEYKKTHEKMPFLPWKRGGEKGCEYHGVDHPQWSRGI